MKQWSNYFLLFYFDRILINLNYNNLHLCILTMINWIHFHYKKRHEIRKQIEIQLFVKEHVQGSQYKLLRFFTIKRLEFIYVCYYIMHMKHLQVAKTFFGFSWVNKMVTKFTCAFSYICGITMKPIMSGNFK